MGARRLRTAVSLLTPAVVCLVSLSPVGAAAEETQWSERDRLGKISSFRSGPALTVGVQGRAAAVWVRGHSLLFAAQRRGKHWAQPAQVHRAATELSDPVAAEARDGRTVVAWVEGGSHVRAMQRTPGQGWTDPVTLSGAGPGTPDPGWPDRAIFALDLTVNPRGQGLLTWFSGVPWEGEIFQTALRSVHLGRAGWGHARTLADNLGINPYTFEADSAVDRDGRGSVLWRFHHGVIERDRLVTVTRRPGLGWGEPVVIARVQGASLQWPHLGVDGEGRVSAAWVRTGNTSALMTATGFAGGRWRKPERVRGDVYALYDLVEFRTGRTRYLWEGPNGTSTSVRTSSGRSLPASRLVPPPDRGYARLAGNRSRDSMLTWCDGAGTDCFAHYLGAGTAREPALRLTQTVGNAPEAAVGPHGEALIGWMAPSRDRDRELHWLVARSLRSVD